MGNILKFEIPNLLETERLTLRKLNLQDAEELFSWASDSELMKYNAWNHHGSVEDTLEFLLFMEDRYTRNELPQNWGITLKKTERLVGTCGFTDYSIINSCATVGYTVARDYWGLGIATEAMKEVLKFAFLGLGCNRVEATCFPENTGSERVLQKLGMSFEGLFREKVFIRGEFHDLSCYSIIRKDYIESGGDENASADI